MTHVALVGAGNIGFAMLSRWIAQPGNASDVVEPRILDRCAPKARHSFSVIEPADALRGRAAKAGATVYSSAEELPGDRALDVVVIATKPQNVGDIAEEYSTRLAPNGLFISVAAGVGIATIEQRSGRSFAVIRCMPNTPAAIGEGVTVCCPSYRATPDNRSVAEYLLSVIGKVIFVDDERLMDAVTAVSGSGPAYLFLFIEALSQAAKSIGLDHELAELLAKQTIYGASKLAMESADTPAVLRRQVTSPNGTTAAGLDVLLRPGNGLPTLLCQAVSAAKKRATQLGIT